MSELEKSKFVFVIFIAAFLLLGMLFYSNESKKEEVINKEFELYVGDSFEVDLSTFSFQGFNHIISDDEFIFTLRNVKTSYDMYSNNESRKVTLNRNDKKITFKIIDYSYEKNYIKIKILNVE